MTVKYTYECPACNHEYIEKRAAGESPFFTTCNLCKSAEYLEKSVNVISQTVERDESPVIIETPTEEI